MRVDGWGIEWTGGSEDNTVAQKRRKCRTGRERALTSDASLGMVGMATTAVVRGMTIRKGEVVTEEVG